MYVNKYVYLPTPHRWHALVPVTSEYFPAPQSKHADALDAPSVARYLPTPHSWHVLNPAVAVYFPAAQSVQVLWPSLEYVPAAHSKHADALDAPSVSRYVPAAQSWQAVAPDCAGRRMRIWLLQSSTVCSPLNTRVST